MSTKPIAQKIHGILLLDKPLSLSSNGVLQRVKRLFNAKKAGHTGSLDPLATGMLPICFGDATKLSQYLLESDKYYHVTATLGVRTKTCDAEGEIIETRPIIDVTPERVENLLKQFTGKIQQIPPMYSALKFQGKPLYKLARQGIEVTREPREVTIHRLQRLHQTETQFSLAVHCTKGTYIRTLVDDIGLALGCGAFVQELRRTAVAPYLEDKMYTLDRLEAIREEDGVAALQQCLLPMESAIQSYPAVVLTSAAAFYLRMGQPVMAQTMLSQGLIRIFSQDGQLLGIGEMLDDGRIAPKRLFASALPIKEAV